MKCPFRIERKTEFHNTKDSTVKEVFADCYEKLCPFFSCSTDLSGKKVIKCKRQR